MEDLESMRKKVPEFSIENYAGKVSAKTPSGGVLTTSTVEAMLLYGILIELRAMNDARTETGGDRGPLI